MSDEFEQELKEGLGRVPAPEGFADRVMERIARKERRRIRVCRRRHRARRERLSLPTFRLNFSVTSVMATRLQ